MHVRQWAYATGLVNALAFVSELTAEPVANNVAGTFVDGTDKRTIKFSAADATAAKVGDYVEFTVEGQTVKANVAVVNETESYATVVL